MIRIVVGTVVIKDDKILMIQEAKEKCYGQWNFPAGHLDEGEYIFDAAVREAKEETGYDIELKNLIQIFSTKDARPQFIMFSGKVVGGEIKFDSTEILDVKWIPLDELFDYDLRRPRQDIEILLERVKTGNVFPLDVVKELK
ncbi:NUDIX domain-containing protein [Candidatus Saccharibacteria bacterium]|nr:NUDIX domain-containing protein [Candidatus Saccharibacteria bacterium]MCL1963363.1 NUDIX domain-containing protein [Candidatus Saccharibacteria bacterium]